MGTADTRLNREAPLALLDRARTPAGAFYRRSNFPVPEVDAAAWRLAVCGEVAEPFTLGLDELRRLPRREVTCTLECAGNGRARLDPLPPGHPWGLGAVGTATFAGAPLADVLDRAGVRAGAVDVCFTGADAGEVEPGRRVAFQRSLSLHAATAPGVLLAWEMDGEPLAAHHGFPCRLVVPRWYGMASVKWLVEVRVLAEAFRGHFQVEKYVYLGERGTPDGTPVARMRVRALVAHPEDGARVVAGEATEVRGTAWSGEAPVARVEVSADGGATWREAVLQRAASPLAAVPWRLEWTPAAGRHALLARATDADGNVQPLAPVWNELGYGNNAVQRLYVTAR